MTNAFQVHGDATVILINQNLEALIDTTDLEVVASWPGRWVARWDDGSKTFYVHGHSRGHKSVLLHRWIMKPEGKLEVDHVHHNGLDNRRNELDVCNRSKNAFNRKGANVGSKSGVRGVHYHSKTGKWRASIWLDGKRKQLGVFASAEEAATARAAAMERKAA